MNAEQMTQLLRDTIPLCGFMNITVNSLDETSIEVFAPLEPNKNVHGTGFAGSLYSLAVVSGWALIQNKITLAVNPLEYTTELVLKQATIHYKRPVVSSIQLTTRFEKHGEHLLNDAKINDALQHPGKLYLPLQITIKSNGAKCATVDAHYVVVAKNKP